MLTLRTCWHPMVAVDLLGRCDQSPAGQFSDVALIFGLGIKERYLFKGDRALPLYSTLVNRHFTLYHSFDRPPPVTGECDHHRCTISPHPLPTQQRKPGQTACTVARSDTFTTDFATELMSSVSAQSQCPALR